MVRKISPLLATLVVLIATLGSAHSPAQIAFETHASICEAVRPANGHHLVHMREGLENPSTRTIWVSCPVTTESIPINSGHYFSALLYNIGPNPIKVSCIFRYMDLATGFRNISRTVAIPAESANFLEWELSSQAIAMTNVNCRLPPDGGIASILSLSGLGLF